MKFLLLRNETRVIRLTFRQKDKDIQASKLSLSEEWVVQAERTCRTEINLAGISPLRRLFGSLWKRVSDVIDQWINTRNAAE